MKLVIAEKMSVALNIAKALGVTDKKHGYMEDSRYIITWCIGHLAGLADAAAYDVRYAKWRYEDLPIIPNRWIFSVNEGKGKQYGIVTNLMKRRDVTEIVNACDAGREGELIFRFIYELAQCSKPFSRLWISSMEESAIRDGFDNLIDGHKFDNLYESALCRAKADWIIGINATR
ncbi:MAG: type IA DNA topoisomerase, partial [Clostridia bacterium]|nr:type IA DNA topoisomerase [Clostridia bacterium]